MSSLLPPDFPKEEVLRLQREIRTARFLIFERHRVLRPGKPSSPEWILNSIFTWGTGKLAPETVFNTQAAAYPNVPFCLVEVDSNTNITCCATRNWEPNG